MRTGRLAGWISAAILATACAGCGNRFNRTNNDPAWAFAHAERAYVAQRFTDGPSQTMGRITRNSPPGMMDSLRRASRSHAAPPAHAGDYLLYVYPPNTVQMTLLHYDSGSGAIGNDQAWFPAPAGFRRWVKSPSAAAAAERRRAAERGGVRALPSGNGAGHSVGSSERRR